MFNITMSTLVPTKTSQSTPDESEQELKLNSKKSQLQVFLGGSCNPTTWRQNLAIPYLEMNGISYYNPQIDNWTPEVVELEYRAKQEAQVLLFVIDDQTRATVTLIESAFMAGDDKNIVFVFYPFESKMNCALEQSSGAYNICETRQGMVRASLNTAENTISFVCTASSESSSSCSASYTTTTSKEKTPASNLVTCTSESLFASTKIQATDKEGSIDLEKKQQLAHLARCSLRLAGEPISVEEFRELKQARSILKNLIDLRKIPTFPDIPQALNHISCHIRSLTPHLKLETNSSSDNGSCLGENRSQKNLTESNKYFTGHNNVPQIKDVYLSIDGDDSTLMDTLVAPMLKANGLTYSYMSIKNIADSRNSMYESSSQNARRAARLMDDETTPDDKEGKQAASRDGALRLLPDQPIEEAELAIEEEMHAIQTSKVLLFIITNKCRGLSIMVLASYFMALLRDSVVLCVQYLEEPCMIGGEILSKTAIADYNRGRVYLCDDAVKSRVPVFSTVREAIDYCSRKCEHIK